MAAFCSSSSFTAFPTDISNFIVCSEVCTWLSTILRRRSSMSLLGSCPCCWPLAVTSVACGPEGFGCVLMGKELGITAASGPGLEADVGDMGGTGRGLKLLDDMASLLLMMLAPSLFCCSALLCPGHTVLCGGENIPLESLRSRYLCTALFCGFRSHCTISSLPYPTKMSPGKQNKPSYPFLVKSPHKSLLGLTALFLLLACMNAPSGGT